MKPDLYPSLSKPAFFASCDRVWREAAASDGATVVRPAPTEIAVKHGALYAGTISSEYDSDVPLPEGRHNRETPHFDPPIKPYLPALDAHNLHPFADSPPP